MVSLHIFAVQLTKTVLIVRMISTFYIAKSFDKLFKNSVCEKFHQADRSIRGMCGITCKLTLFLPAMGGISPYMSVT